MQVTIVRRAIRRNRGAIVLGTVLMSCYQGAETMVAVLLGVITAWALEGSVLALVLAVGALALTIGAVSLSWRFGMRVLQRASTTEAHRWRVKVASATMQPIPVSTNLKSGEVLAIATDDADRTADIIEVLPLLLSSFFAVMVAAIVLTTISVPIGLLIIGGTPLVMVILAVIARQIGFRTQAQQAKVAKAGASVSDLVAGLRPLQGFGGNRVAFARYRAISKDAAGQAVSVARITGAYAGVALLLNMLLAVAVTLTAGWLALRGTISVAELVTAVGLSQFVMEPLKMFTDMPKHIAMARASAHRMALVLDAPPAFRDGDSVPGIKSGAAAVELDALGYGALQALSLRVEPGEFVAVLPVDAAVSGDLFSVLSLTAPPASYPGTVRLHGLAVDNMPLRALRSRLLVAPHHGEVFTGTLRSNIALRDDRSASDDALAPAVAASCLTDVVALFEDGLDHHITDRGANLSGGQRQRLTLARALAADPEILVLHDPTTAVDAVTEQRIAAGITEMRRGRTTIVVASSPPLLALADRVIVISGGKQTVSGIHHQLMADEQYRRAVTR